MHPDLSDALHAVASLDQFAISLSNQLHRCRSTPRWPDPLQQGRVLHLKALDPSSCKLAWGPTLHLPSDSLSLGLGSSSSVSLTGFSLYEVHSIHQHLPRLEALFSVTKTPQALVWLSPVKPSHLNSRICSAYAALCLRSVCFMRVSARVLVGLSFGFSAVAFGKKTAHWCIW